MAFYDVFEQLCNERGITPTQVARDNGLTQQTVSHWKTRGSTPKAETVQKLADYFGVSIDYLLGKSDTFTKESELREYISEWERQSIQGEKTVRELASFFVDAASSSVSPALANELRRQGFAEIDSLISSYSELLRGFEKFVEKMPKALKSFPDVAQNLDRMRDTRNLLVHIRSNELAELLSKLNSAGQEKAKERIEELTEIPRYRAETTPQSPPAPTEGKDTTPPPDAPETLSEGE